MRHKSSLYRVCGPALILSGLLLLAAFSVKPPQPAALEAAVELRLDLWVLTNWMFVVGAIVLLGGWMGLTEHLNDDAVEGWSIMGLGGVMIGAIGLALAAAINAETLPRLLEMYTDGSRGIATQSYITVQLTTRVLGWMSWTIMWIGMALTGLAIAEDPEYPTSLGYTGLVIAMVEIASQLVRDTSLLHDAFGIIGCVWVIAVGVIFTRIEVEGRKRKLAREEVRV